MKKIKRLTEIVFSHISDKYTIILLSILLIAVTGIFALAVETASGKDPSGIQSGFQSSVPEIKMVYDNKAYKMSPFVLASEGQIRTMIVPHDDPSDDNPAVHIQIGKTVRFQFDKQPAVIQAFTVDYEGDLPSLHALKKIRSNEFQIVGPNGMLNLEVHAYFADGRYTSQDIITNVTAGGHPDVRNFDIEGANQDSSNSPIIGEQSCSRSGRLQVSQISSSSQNNINALVDMLHHNTLDTAWMTKGMDVKSFIASSLNRVNNPANQDPWLQLDLGKDKTICNIIISFGERDKNINFFTLQTSTDGVHFKNIGSAETSPVEGGPWLFTFPEMPVQARYVRISNLGNVASEEIKINAFAAGGSNSNDIK